MKKLVIAMLGMVLVLTGVGLFCLMAVLPQVAHIGEISGVNPYLFVFSPVIIAAGGVILIIIAIGFPRIPPLI